MTATANPVHCQPRQGIGPRILLQDEMDLAVASSRSWWLRLPTPFIANPNRARILLHNEMGLAVAIIGVDHANDCNCQPHSLPTPTVLEQSLQAARTDPALQDLHHTCMTCMSWKPLFTDAEKIRPWWTCTAPARLQDPCHEPLFIFPRFRFSPSKNTLLCRRPDWMKTVRCSCRSCSRIKGRWLPESWTLQLLTRRAPLFCAQHRHRHRPYYANAEIVMPTRLSEKIKVKAASLPQNFPSSPS